MMPTAITRDVNAAMGKGELTFLPRLNIDIERARQQHQQYQMALARLGCDVHQVPTGQGLADSVFIEDTAIVLDELAILCRPGAVSRRPEVAEVETTLAAYRSLACITGPGTLDGGDVLTVGKTIFAGLSSRSNKKGIRQLSDIVAPHGYSVTTVETAQCLHLKSAISQVSVDTLLLNPEWIESSAFSHFNLIKVDQREPHAANALLVGQSIIYPTSFPATRDKLLQRGITIEAVDVSEVQKAEGAVTCCSLVLNG